MAGSYRQISPWPNQPMNGWMGGKALGWEFRDLASSDGDLDHPLVLSGPLFSMFVGINSPIKQAWVHPFYR